MATASSTIQALPVLGVPSIDLFHLFVVGHIIFGAVGLVLFWVPVTSRKGSWLHRHAGRVFTMCMLVTGCLAILISLTTLYDPAGTHPHLMTHADFGTVTIIRDIFGWLMLYLAILTLNLTWYGWQTVRHKLNRAAIRDPLNLFLQAALLVATVNCTVRGLMDAQVLMIGISAIGYATVVTNLWFLYKPKPWVKDWLMEHIKALVGTGISVYTAFFAFGAVRFLPEAALTPALWSVPLVVGLSIIFYQWYRVKSSARGGRKATARMVR